MPIFLGTHDFKGEVTKEEMEEIWKNYSEACKKHGATGHKVFFNAESGRTWCITEAESAEAVTAAHNEVGKPTIELFEVEKIK